MRIAFLAAIAFVVSVSVVPRNLHADGKEDELKKLQGIWTIVDLDMYGQSQMNDPERITTFRIAGDSMMVFDKHDSLYYDFILHNLNPSASPSAVDLTMKKGVKSLGEYLAVYKLDGDNLQLCWWGKENNKPRPKKLGKGEGLVMIVLKRVK